MKDEESIFLYGQKRRDGFNSSEANQEVREFKHSQREFKTLNREHKKAQTKIRNLEKNNEKLKERVRDLKDKVRNLKQYKTEKKGKAMFLEQIEKETNVSSKNGSIVHARRVLRYAPKGEWLTQSDLAKIIGTAGSHLKPTLRFLVDVKLLERGSKRGIVNYRLK
jgi:DNA-binding transcriptional regulator GbsR (MarR family)